MKREATNNASTDQTLEGSLIPNATFPTQAPQKTSRLQRILSSQKLQDIRKIFAKDFWGTKKGLLYAAVLCGVFSGLLNYYKDLSVKQDLEDRYQVVMVLAAGSDLEAGDLLGDEAFMQVPVLASNLSKNHIRIPQKSLVTGRRLLLPMKKGDPLYLTAIQGIDEAHLISQKIPLGKRLFTLTIRDHAVQHGFIRPGDRVDVLAHVELPNRGLTTFTLLQNVSLVSVGKTSIVSKKDRQEGTDVSFFVENRHSEMLAFTQQRGSFSLSLRNPEDFGVKEKGPGIDVNEFLDYDGIESVSGGAELKVLEKGRAIEKDDKE